ncbi:MAG: DNA-processing protein DprA [Conexibacteraceae bacterium]|nr:DNA-processing protein DprA [Conexibacteraceae bacterium]
MSREATGGSQAPAACDRCLARTWLLGRLGGHLEVVRGRVGELLELDDERLILAVGGRDRTMLAREHARFAGDAADESRTRSRAAGLALICRCDPAYPPALAALEAPPAVLHIAGDAERFLAVCGPGDVVAIVGTRAASGYGLDVAATLGRGLGAAGVTVVSGMATGIDAAAQRGALAGGGATVAVLPGAANRPYPRSERRLYREVVAAGAAVSELGPGANVWRWSLQARNRLVAGLATMTVVVEAGARSGSLITARVAAQLGRTVGAVPGLVTSPRASGTNALLAEGATVVRGAQDVLNAVFGAGVRIATADARAAPTPRQAALLREIGSGRDTVAKLGRAALAEDSRADASQAHAVMTELAALELGGWVRRGAGGRFTVVP